jgi:chromosome segregation ATPase
VKRRAARKGDKRGIGFSSKGIEQLQKETVRLQAAIDRIQEENAKHRQLLNLVKEEANQTELSLRDEIKRLQEEKRKAEEQVEQLKAEHQLRENKWKAEVSLLL